MSELSPSITVVCVYNRQDILERYLLTGLARQNEPYDLQLLDNRGGRFSSAAAALNAGARQAQGGTLLFIHQDVELLSPTFLRDALAYLGALPDWGVAGVAGAVRGSFGRHLCLGAAGMSAPRAVQTLDEQLLIVRAVRFRDAPFDEVACDGWDLYGVDYSLSCQTAGLKVYVLPLAAQHASWGRLRRSYYVTLGRVMGKHRALGTIFTTCGIWHPALPVWLNFLIHKVRAAGRRAAAARPWRVERGQA